jgi:hypothetical protein
MKTHKFTLLCNGKKIEGKVLIGKDFVSLHLEGYGLGGEIAHLDASAAPSPAMGLFESNDADGPTQVVSFEKGG